MPLIPGTSFDAVFARYERSRWLRTRFGPILDPQLPPEVEPFSHVPLSGLREVAAALRVAAGETIVDLACGRGGPGLWIARETATDLVGVDASALAVARAATRAGRFGAGRSGADRRSRFVVGDLAATGLPGTSADGVVCVDGFQFAADPAACAGEVLRVLRPGRRFVLTSWEPRHPGEGELPDWFRGPPLSPVLAAAGFTVLDVGERPTWEQAQRRGYDAALAAGDPGTDDGLAMLQDEARITAPILAWLRRVIVVAQRP